MAVCFPISPPICFNFIDQTQTIDYWSSCQRCRPVLICSQNISFSLIYTAAAIHTVSVSVTYMSVCVGTHTHTKTCKCSCQFVKYINSDEVLLSSFCATQIFPRVSFLTLVGKKLLLNLIVVLYI